MSDNQENLRLGGKGFLGNKFKVCPFCGELNGGEAESCRFCLRSLTGEMASAKESGEGIGPEKRFKEEEKKAESFFPPEETIPSGNTYCWPALWFADLWLADKGLVNEAWEHFRYRVPALIFGVLTILLSGAIASYEGRTPPAFLTVIATFFMLLWLVTFLIALAKSHEVAQRAYRKWEEVRKAEREGRLEVRAEGSQAYWTILLVPYIVFLCCFFVALVVMS